MGDAPIRGRITAPLLFVVLILAAQGCGQSEHSTQSDNSPPTKALLDHLTGAPPDGSDRREITPVLSWKCFDADGDPLAYDVHLGTSEPLPLLSSYRVQSCLVSGPLAYSTTYYWRVVARDNHGNSSVSETWSFTTRSAPLICDVSASPTEGLPPLPVSFTGSASDGKAPYAYFWVFGDGGTSLAQSPQYTYLDPGTYHAVLQVTDAESSYCSQGVVIVVEGPPDCKASANPMTGLPPLLVFFDAEASGGRPPYAYRWIFGDGGESTSEHATHIYTGAGIYNAALVVTDAKSLTCSTTVLIIAAPPLTCDASANPAGGPRPLTVSFIATAADGKDPYSYFWTFGDGGSSAAQNAVHTYSRVGPFTAVLLVTDATGTACSKTLNIVVLP